MRGKETSSYPFPGRRQPKGMSRAEDCGQPTYQLGEQILPIDCVFSFFVDFLSRRWFEMDKNGDIIILLAEEQTFLSRERTMHSYMQTGLAFSSVGLLIMKYLGGVLYFCAGLFFIIIGALLIIEAGKRYMRFRRAIATLREKEARLGYDTGIIR